MAHTDDYILPVLQQLNLARPEQVEMVRAEAGSLGVVHCMIIRGIITPLDVARAKASHFGCECVDLHDYHLSPAILGILPADIAWQYQVIPLEHTGDSLTVAMADPGRLDAIDSLSHIFGVPITVKAAPSSDIQLMLRLHYPHGAVTLLENMTTSSET